jgi:hypothetical protein
MLQYIKITFGKNSLKGVANLLLEKTDALRLSKLLLEEKLTLYALLKFLFDQLTLYAISKLFFQSNYAHLGLR